MELPKHTRLRYVASKNAELIPRFFEGLARRVQVWSVTHTGKKHFVWFSPDDRGDDVKSVDLDEV
jgi:hypothetical protein